MVARPAPIFSPSLSFSSFTVVTSRSAISPSTVVPHRHAWRAATLTRSVFPFSPANTHCLFFFLLFLIACRGGFPGSRFFFVYQRVGQLSSSLSLSLALACSRSCLSASLRRAAGVKATGADELKLSFFFSLLLTLSRTCCLVSPLISTGGGECESAVLFDTHSADAAKATPRLFIHVHQLRRQIG